MSNKKWSEKEIEFLKANYKNYTYEELGKLMNRSREAVQLKISKLGMIKSKYNYNKDYFEKIDSRDKAYWLGFIWADGYIMSNTEYRNYELGIELQKSDAVYLRKFNKAISGNIPLGFRKREAFIETGRKIFCEICQIRIYCKKMVEDLIDKGLFQNKSLSIGYPKHLDDKYFFDFLRGYFDGNGSVLLAKDRKSLRGCFSSGSKEILERIKEKLYDYSINSYISIEEKRPTELKLFIGGLNNSLKFFELLYKDTNEEIRLERKYSKFIKIKEEYYTENRRLF